MTTVNELILSLSLTPLLLSDGERPVTGGYCGDLLSWVMGRAKAGDAWVTIMSNVNVAAVAQLADPACVILAENVAPDPALLSAAKRSELNLLSSPDGAFALAAKIAALL